MLSILIPAYNYDVRKLVNDLHDQGLSLNLTFEIIITEDGSDDEFIQKNRELDDLSHVNYEVLKKNIGRSAIRNYLANKAKYNYLIYMDCDSGVPDDQYLKRYIPYCDDKTYIVYGGRMYRNNVPDKPYRLHYKYGINREVIPAKSRRRRPNRSFMSNNFLVMKKLIKQVNFDEDLVGYGHEDTLFGLDLQNRGIQIIHIDNPLIHEGLETTEQFLYKTQQGIRNLYQLYIEQPEEHDLTDEIKLLRWFDRLHKSGLRPLMALFFFIFNKLMKKQLESFRPSLYVFDIYKLGYICNL
jgi:glycosyltransferase involved in cell wall biosynthesis